MPLSLLDMPAVREAVSDLHRILEDPTPTNETARRAFRWSTGRSTLGEQGPAGKTASALVDAGVERVIYHLGDHTRDQCPEITDSQLDLKTKVALLELREKLLPPFASHALATDGGERLRFLVFLDEVLRRISPSGDHNVGENQLAHRGGATDKETLDAIDAVLREAGPAGAVGDTSAGPAVQIPADAKKGKADPGKPSRDRQDDIIATIRSEGVPLTKEELTRAMKMKTVGKLGHNLAWMVKNGILINIPQRGYWPAGTPEPK